MVERAELAKIADAARSLIERLELRQQPGGLPAPDSDSSGRFDRYCRVVATGDSTKLARRVAWDRLDTEALRHAVSGTPGPASSDLPVWTSMLAQVIEQTRSTSDTAWKSVLATPRDGSPQEGGPFQEVWIPAVEAARKKLTGRLRDSGFRLEGQLAPGVHEDLARALLTQLSRTAAQTLYEEFNRHRPVGLALLGAMKAGPRESVGRSHYEAFIRGLTSDGLMAFFLKYPVLARLVSQLADDWVDSSEEFLTRLAADLPLIGSDFLAGDPSRALVTSVRPSLSDRHRGGRSVTIVSFDDGSRIVYKPRDVGIEVAYNAILKWCNSELRDGLPLQTLCVLERAGYGWVEHVEQNAVDSAEAARRFYRRAGRHLCLLYLLGATDCHHGNLIASGEQPVLIDLETLVYHQISWLRTSPEEADLLGADYDRLWDSVSRTLMLPTWQAGGDGESPSDISALGGVEAEDVTHRGARWRFLNTDQMVLVKEDWQRESEKNTLTMNGEQVSPLQHVDDIVAGFREMYDFLLSRQQELQAEQSPLGALRNRRVRYIFRSTWIYNLLADHSLNPKYLGNGADRSIELEFLSRALLHSEDRPLEWPVVAAEIASVERLDVPYFDTTTDSRALRVDVGGESRSVEDIFEQPSYERMLTRLARWGEADRDLQIQMIEGSFHAKTARDWQPAPTVGDLSQAPETAELPDYVGHATELSDELHRRSIRLENGGLAWMTLEYVLNTQRFQYQPANASLYEGACGISLFFAAHARITGDSRSRDRAVRALEPFRRLLRLARQSGERYDTLGGIDLGGGIGLGSAIYSLTTIGQLLGDGELISDAEDIARVVTEEATSADRKLDVLYGAAGAILGLLKLHGVTGSSHLLEKSRLCGEHLLEQRERVAEGVSAWRVDGATTPFGGMAHGPSGVCLALARLHRQTGDPAYLQAAHEGLAYERMIFSEELGDWPDLRHAGAGVELESTGGWCHGAPGFGLARVAMLREAPELVVAEEVELALRRTIDRNLLEIDTVCCGNYGRAEFLLMAGKELGRPHLVDQAHRIGSLVEGRARRSGGHEFIPDLPKRLSSPGFFRGSAGVGYQLLRLAEPEILPSVLVWD